MVEIRPGLLQHNKHLMCCRRVCGLFGVLGSVKSMGVAASIATTR